MIPILMYHQIAEIPRKLDPGGNAVLPSQFEQQMRYLKRNDYQCLTLPEAVQYYQKGGSVPARSFVLTFDDGYQDFPLRVCPILEKFGFTATVFLVANRLGFPSNWWGQDGAYSGMLLSWSEAKDLARRGYILGSHTLSHSFLRSLDDQCANEEIGKSRELLQDKLDIQVNFFSYPYSDSDARIERLVKSAGYTAACAGNLGSQSVFHLWRVPCQRSDTTLSFSLKASGWYDRRTALRESVPGRLLRRSVRMLLRKADYSPSRHLGFLNPDLDTGSERKP